MSIRVGILGATGAVGQRLVELLAPHPQFEVAVLTASESSAGHPYREAATWRLDAPIPDGIAAQTVVETDPSALPEDVSLLFSALPSDVGAQVEPAFCEAGYVVSSNASNERMATDVPLVIPELNADHLELLEVQRAERGWDGALVKNPNCSTITFVPTLAPLTDYGLERVHVATLQAVSGAGYDGVTSMEILDNAVPHIGGEAEKLETESRKLLGSIDGDRISHHDVTVSASVNRIPTLDGHLENVWVETAESISPDIVADAMTTYPGIDLPTAPDPFIEVLADPDRPQPRLDRRRGDGMAISVGGLDSTTTGGIQYNCLAHNTIRGAAGASVLNGELLVERGYV
ncbi:aspartate-semialdehyde dehydrogenase [Halovivax ruber XH-70]|uniref:Aspartate-semialdehyde dehydrogenase n=1 Tax=Halovivax ruber (strain DSM 18193 / JCM 13892 / XH-70) TaxID=797302 RepID=L0I9R5_HALRX|nr:aspartate-semialdehyde dehydrogenase [Halovivax ruber]AGB16315.1 aspartate-semialdehyde dehydrogenase [Halovivax ruber XH-70]